MKSLVILALSLSATFALADSSPVLTLQRVNYKAEKRLVYGLVFDKSRCEINTSSPFDVYYKENSSGRRLPDFSSDSKDYFGPRIDRARTNTHQVALQFKAFDEIQNAIGTPAEIMIHLDNSSGECKSRTEIAYSARRYDLDHIDIQVTKFLGFPNGVEWVNLKGHDATGPITDCVVGSCR